MTFWVNQSPFLFCNQHLVWRFHYRGKPLAFGPQDITSEGSTDIWTWREPNIYRKKKKNVRKLCEIWWLIEVVYLVLVIPEFISQTMTLLDAHYHTLCWRPKCVLSPDVILYLLLVTAGTLQCCRCWLTIDLLICTSPCSAGRADSSSLVQFCCYRELQIQACRLKSTGFDSWGVTVAQALWIINDKISLWLWSFCLSHNIMSYYLEIPCFLLKCMLIPSNT